MSVLVKENNRWTVVGIEQPPATELARNDQCMVLRVPGHKYWAQVSLRGYAAAVQQVWLIERQVSDSKLIAKQLIEFRTGNQALKQIALIGRSPRRENE